MKANRQDKESESKKTQLMRIWKDNWVSYLQIWKDNWVPYEFGEELSENHVAGCW